LRYFDISKQRAWRTKQNEKKEKHDVREAMMRDVENIVSINMGEKSETQTTWDLYLQRLHTWNIAKSIICPWTWICCVIDI
jgi:hypothetical protein